MITNKWWCLSVIYFLLGGTAFCDASVFSNSTCKGEYAYSWAKIGNGDVFAWSPLSLYEVDSYEESIKAIRRVAIRGEYFDGVKLVRELDLSVNIHEYAPLFGWSEALMGTSSSWILIHWMSQELNDDNKMEKNTILAYCLASLLDAESRRDGISEQRRKILMKHLNRLNKPIS